MRAGENVISRPSTMFTSGSTAFTCKPDWKTKSDVYLCAFGHEKKALIEIIRSSHASIPRGVQALFWSAFINGVVAVPVMVLMMLLTANTKVMGQFTVTGVLRFTGWLATAVMAAAVAGMLVTAGV